MISPYLSSADPRRLKLHNFHQGRWKLFIFHLITSVGQGPMKDKVLPIKKSFFHRFLLIFCRPLADGRLHVSCTVNEQDLIGDKTVLTDLVQNQKKSQKTS
jgi:hypothetical protein